MNREQKLRNIILDKYISLRKFANAAEIPYSTLTTILERGIAGASFDTIIKICQTLEIDPEKI
ncbi:MAG: helix-turn-helix transcriptional regulator [Oscillospiraceae bacterium]|nr:helix-turn-helix transcriptional regulator [Oscillospiraceae bacterium]